MLVKDFIQCSLSDQIEQMTLGSNGYATYPYQGFSLITMAIEALGACLDDNDWGEKGFSESRFRLAIARLFPDSYQQYNNKENLHDLYKGLRCSLVHILMPGSLISLSERKWEDKAGVTGAHLAMQNGKLLLIYEDLLYDFKQACGKVIEMIDKKEIAHQKVYTHNISVPSDKANN